MPCESAITSKGVADDTKEEAIREYLHVKPGDRVKFFMHPDAAPSVVPKLIVVTAIAGSSRWRGRPATLEEICDNQKPSLLEQAKVQCAAQAAMIGLDSNILLRYVTQDDPVQAAQATEVIEHRLTEQEPGFISVVAMVEMVWVLQRFYRFGSQRIVAAIERMLGAETLVVEYLSRT